MSVRCLPCWSLFFDAIIQWFPKLGLKGQWTECFRWVNIAESNGWLVTRPLENLKTHWGSELEVSVSCVGTRTDLKPAGLRIGTGNASYSHINHLLWIVKSLKLWKSSEFAFTIFLVWLTRCFKPYSWGPCFLKMQMKMSKKLSALFHYLYVYV